VCPLPDQLKPRPIDKEEELAMLQVFWPISYEDCLKRESESNRRKEFT